MSIENGPDLSLRAIYLAALEIADQQQRQAYLDRACHGDAARRREVERLLEAREADRPNLLERALEQLDPAETRGFQVDDTAESDNDDQPNIDRYELLEQIGEGGMGTVYLAQQYEPIQRQVALKVIKAGMDTREVISRFQTEQQTLAMMDHPNIAHVLDAGTTPQGRPYFVMELVLGVSLTDYCDQHRLSIRERLRLFLDVCRAVQHAHQKGIIHRDLKPSNMMVTQHDGKPAVKVIDFGVAKALDQDLLERTSLTQWSQVIGTPLYMSPEQAEMGGQDIDTRSDVYSLGVVLYELLTGTTPFDKETLSNAGFDGMRRIIREVEPARPSHKVSTLDSQLLSRVSNCRKTEPWRLAEAMRRELDWIVIKALEKDRNRRYESASSLAADIEHFLNDEPVKACPPSARYRLAKIARRHGHALLAGCLILAAVLAGAAGSVWYALKADQQTAVANAAAFAAEQDRKRADNNLEFAERTIFNLTLTEAARSIGDSPGTVAAQLEDEQKCPPRFRDITWNLLHAMSRRDLAKIDVGAPCEALCQASEGRLILVGLQDGTIRVDEGETSIQKQVHTEVVESIVELDDSTFASCSRDGSVYLYDREFQNVVQIQAPNSVHMNGMAVSPDRKLLATIGEDGHVRLYSVPERKMTKRFKAHEKRSYGIAFSPDGKTLATSSGDTREICLWDIATLQRKTTLLGHKSYIANVCFSHDGHYLASCSWDHTVRIWNAETGEVVHVLNGPRLTMCAAFTQDDSQLVTGWADSMIRVWDVDSGRLVETLPGHADDVRDLATTNDEQIITCSLDGTIRTWHLSDALRVQTLAGNKTIRRVDFNEKFGSMATGDNDGRVEVWDLATGQLLLSELLADSPVRQVIWSPDGTKLCVVGENPKHAGVWQLDPLKRLLNVSADFCFAVAYSPRNDQIALGGYRVVTLVDLASGKRRQTSEVSNEIWGVAYSPDGRQVVAASRDGEINVWNADTLKHLARFHTGAGQNNFARFSPDGETLLTAGNGRTLMLWNTADWQRRLVLRGHDSEPTGGRFHRDGQTIITSHGDGTISFWDSLLGQHRGRLKANSRIAGKLYATADQSMFAFAVGAEVRVYRSQQQTALALPIADQEANLQAARAVRRRSQNRFDVLQSTVAQLTESLHVTIEEDNRKSLLWQRAVANVNLRNWKAAANDAIEITEQYPEDRLNWLRSGVILLMANDDDAYREHVQHMLERFQNTADRNEASATSKLCALVRIPIGHRETVERLAGFARQEAPEGKEKSWAFLREALIQYRFGEYQGCLESIADGRRHLEPHLIRESPHTEVVEIQNCIVESMCYFKQGKRPEALHALDQARLSMDQFFDNMNAEDHHDIYSWLIATHLLRELRQLAAHTEIERLSEELASDPSGEERQKLLVERAAAYAFTKQWKLAAADYRQGVDREALIWLRTCVMLVEANDYESYTELAQQALEQHGKTKNIYTADWIVKPCVLREETIGDLQQLEELAEFSVQHGLNEHWASHFPLGLALVRYRSGDFDAAHDAVAESRRRNGPNSASPKTAELACLTIEALCYLKQGEVEVAIDSLRRARFLLLPFTDGDHSPPLHNIHNWLIGKILYDEAMTHLDAKQRAQVEPAAPTMVNNPDKAREHVRRARSHLFYDRQQEAIAELKASSQAGSASNSPAAPMHRTRAELYARLHAWQAAADELAREIEMNPTDQWPWHLRASLLGELGDHEQLRRHCQAMLGQFGTTEIAKNARRTAQCCSYFPGMVDDLSEIKSLLDQSALTERFITLPMTYGIIAYRQGSYDESLQHFTESHRVGGSPSFRIRTRILLAATCFQQGDLEQATRWLAEAEELAGPILGSEEPKLTREWHDDLFSRALHRRSSNVIARPASPADNR